MKREKKETGQQKNRFFNFKVLYVIIEVTSSQVRGKEQNDIEPWGHYRGRILKSVKIEMEIRINLIQSIKKRKNCLEKR